MKRNNVDIKMILGQVKKWNAYDFLQKYEGGRK